MSAGLHGGQVSLYSELKDRKVIRVAGIYLVVAWIIIQVVDVVSEPLFLPEWFPTAVILLLVLGFPFALIFSWIFDAKLAESSGSGLGKPLAIGVVAATAVVAGFVVFNFITDKPQPVTDVVDAPQESSEPELSAVTGLPDSNLLPNSVAVLLCDNLSPDPDDAYFAAGIHEEILNQLVKLSSLNVIARTSVLTYAGTNMTIPEIANELSVESVLECSVRFAGTSIMVTAQLIDPISNSHIWSESYPGDIGDLSGIFAMQADIAMNIANALQAEFSPAEQQRLAAQPTHSSEAYRLYLQATAMQIYLNYPQIEELLDRAIELDPGFVEAHAYMAMLLATLSTTRGLNEEEVQKGRRASRSALELDPLNARALVAQYIFESGFFSTSISRVSEFFENLIQTHPNDSYVLEQGTVAFRNVGDYRTALRLGEQLVALDPNSNAAWRQLSQAQLFAGQPEEALVSMQNALARDPEDLSALWNLLNINVVLGRDAEAMNAYRLFENVNRNALPAGIQAQTALMLSMVGAEAEVATLVEEIREAVPIDSSGSLELGMAHLAVGDSDQAWDEMSRAIERANDQENSLGYQISIRLKRNIWNHPVLNESRFVALRSQLAFLED